MVEIVPLAPAADSPNRDLRRLLADLTAIVGAIAAHALKLSQSNFKYWEKSKGQILSDIDLAVDEALARELKRLLPEVAWLSEESRDNKERLHSPKLWVVDPIDGTRDLVRGRGGWCLSVALVENGEPLLAVLNAPALGLVYSSFRGGGAWLNGQAIFASDCQDLSGARVPADHLPPQDRDLVMVAKPNSIALRMAMVAMGCLEGGADLVASVRPSNEWDVAAAALIVSEAGGRVSDALGRALRFNQPEAKIYGIVATAPAIHAQAIARLADRAIF